MPATSYSFIGEYPVWSAAEDILYWLDLAGRRLHAVRSDGRPLAPVALTAPVGAIAVRARGGLVAASPSGFSVLDPRSGRLTPFAPAPWSAGEAANDGKCDPGGRFWVGTKDLSGGIGAGALYRLDPGGSCRRMEGGFGNTNGFGWSPDGGVMYVTETRRWEIYAYPYQAANGSLGPRRILARVPHEHGKPDGSTVDSEGCIWSANWEGGKVIRYTPNGAISSILRVAAACPTSCTFGGPALDVLYVTAALAGPPPDLDDPRPAGSLLALVGLGRGREDMPFAG